MSDGRLYPARPILGLGAVIIDSGRVLLIERGKEPLKGYWSLPGGALEVGERIEDGIRREVREETGLEVELLGVVEIFERVTRDGEGKAVYHFVLIDYLCSVTGGTLAAGDDASRAEWVRREHLANYRITEGTLPVIDRAFDERNIWRKAAASESS
ncbi:MAG: NUDIX domain-containing protein [Bryobacterales bacterium]|nr:NUDIX domain-containing protein [Bryobacterales bacterium]